MKEMMLNLNSLAMMLCTCDFHADIEVALTGEEISNIFINSLLSNPNKLLGPFKP